MLIKVRVFPASSKEEIVQKSKDSFEAFTREKPQRGKATKAVKEILEGYFETNKIKLIKGAKTRNKIFEVIGLL